MHNCGLDGHSLVWTGRRAQFHDTATGTHTDTHTREQAHGSCVGPGRWHREGWGPHASSGGRCDRIGPVAGDKGVNVTLGKDGVEGSSEVPCSPLPGPCKPLKALLGHLLENGDVAGFCPYEGPIPPPHTALSQPLGSSGCPRGTRKWCFCPQSLPCRGWENVGP